MAWNPWAHPHPVRLLFDGVERPLLVARLSVGQKANYQTGLARLVQVRGTFDGQLLSDEEAEKYRTLATALHVAAEDGAETLAAAAQGERATALRTLAGEARVLIGSLVDHRLRLEHALVQTDLEQLARRDEWDARLRHDNEQKGEWLNAVVEEFVRVPEPWVSADGLTVTSAADLLQAYQDEVFLTALVFAIWRENSLTPEMRKNLRSPSGSPPSSAERTADRTGEPPAAIAANADGSASVAPGGVTGEVTPSFAGVM